MANHSLDAAVAAGVVSPEAAFCGLSAGDVAELDDRGFSDARLIVVFRSGSGDGRMVTSARDVRYGTHFHANGQVFGQRHIRTVYPVAL